MMPAWIIHVRFPTVGCILLPPARLYGWTPIAWGGVRLDRVGCNLLYTMLAHSPPLYCTLSYPILLNLCLPYFILSHGIMPYATQPLPFFPSEPYVAYVTLPTLLYLTILNQIPPYTYFIIYDRILPNPTVLNPITSCFIQSHPVILSPTWPITQSPIVNSNSNSNPYPNRYSTQKSNPNRNSKLTTISTQP